MNSIPFYSVIVGTELLNGRRIDKHFMFVNQELIRRGWEHAGNFMVSDDPAFLETLFQTIASYKNSVMFCFGGIGATPDDYTRQVAAGAFAQGELAIHPEGERIILEKMGERAYPNGINMANLPVGSELLFNPVNNIPGFYLQERFFFMPGFPDMAHPMVVEALDRFYPKNREKFRKTLQIRTGEGSLIAFMQELPEGIELSSLPEMRTEKGPLTTLSLASYEEETLDLWFNKLLDYVHTHEWEHILGEK